MEGKIYKAVEAKEGIKTAFVAMHPIIYQMVIRDGYIPEQEELTLFVEVDE